MEPKKQLPNATATLVLGILSIVFCWCYGILGLILGIIAVVISSKSVQLYNANPEEYDGYGNLKAGRIMAFIGIGLSAIYVIFFIVYVFIIGAALPWEEMMNNY